MWRTLLAFVCFLGALVLASRVPFPDVRAPERERAALERVVDAYVRANAAEDVAALTGLYADDALLLPPDEGLIEGRNGIETFWTSGMEPGLLITPVRVEIHGDAGLVVGRYTVPEHADSPADSGKCVLMFRRSGPNWRITADIWNTSTPRADAMPEGEPGDSVPAVIS